MKATLAVAVFCLLAVLASCNPTTLGAPELWELFKTEHNKQYATKDEHDLRYMVFQQNLKRINEMNRLSEAARFAVNKFADLTKEEFRTKYLSKAPVRDNSMPVAADLNTGDLPDSFDWRDHGAVTGVKDQSTCGSCWAFSTVANVEGQWFLAGNPLTSLSEQNLVDCDHECITYEGQQSCDSGCDGGLQPSAYQYIIKNGGIDTENSYPYEGVDGKCRFKSNSVGARINNFTMVSTDENQIAAYLVNNGPLAIAADAATWQFYFGGVLDTPCGTSLDHGIAIVGYGVETTLFGRKKPYWLIKNSWGAGWGEKGYIRVERGVGKCGVNLYVSSAVVNKN